MVLNSSISSIVEMAIYTMMNVTANEQLKANLTETSTVFFLNHQTLIQQCLQWILM